MLFPVSVNVNSVTLEYTCVMAYLRQSANQVLLIPLDKLFFSLYNISIF